MGWKQTRRPPAARTYLLLFTFSFYVVSSKSMGNPQFTIPFFILRNPSIWNSFTGRATQSFPARMPWGLANSALMQGAPKLLRKEARISARKTLRTGLWLFQRAPPRSVGEGARGKGHLATQEAECSFFRSSSGNTPSPQILFLA